ncbi:hypothetical protein Tsubulata_010703 [Turnera subulata]|uniref:FAD-binding PCMH-type domain-containing protein n=1 Tax=Turnera subulata TaxID=218843 RepID=A0A9Q0FSK8_9ROSI|nr:hypothetical protein Tsubulata_010703 [Turnera subulata]
MSTGGTAMSLMRLLVSVLIIMLSGSLAASNPDVDKFLQCLRSHSHSHPSNYPIDQAIYTPTSSSFQTALEAFITNRRFVSPSTPKPVAIIAAKHESHIQATILCAKASGLQIRTRSGGHDYDGLSYVSEVPFIILDMLNLRSIDVDIAGETAWVQAGATLGELYHKIANLSNVHAFPAGVCFTLGAGGHFSGGGYGTMMRKYGLSVDNIVDAQIVDVNGNILDRKSMGEDLFWAIRGGGGASFGVILSWKIKLVRVPPTVTVFQVDRTLEQGATDVVYKWQQVASKLDRELFIRAMPQVVNGTGAGVKTVRVSFIGFFLGESGPLLSLVGKSFSELGLQQRDCVEMRWVESTLFWYGIPRGTSVDVLLDRLQGPQSFYERKSDYVKDIISKESLESIWKSMIEYEPLWMQWNPYGGIMSEIPSNATPFPHRAGYLFLIQYSTDWNEEGIEATNRYMNLSRKMHEAMTPYVSKYPREAFLNYRDVDIGSNPSNQTSFDKAVVYGTKYFRDNFFRLVKVKARVDPDNFFKNEQSIPSTLASAN